MSKNQFIEICFKQIGSQIRACQLNLLAEVLCWLMRLTQDNTYDYLTSLFDLNSKDTVYNIFYRQTMHFFKKNNNIPIIIDSSGQVNEQELDKLYQTAYRNTPLYFKSLVRNFLDPAGLNRTPVIINVDATYLGKCPL